MTNLNNFLVMICCKIVIHRDMVKVGVAMVGWVVLVGMFLNAVAIIASQDVVGSIVMK